MFISFECSYTEALANDRRVKRFTGIESVAQRKLRQLQIARRLQDLRVPQSNRLEALRGDCAGQHSITNAYGLEDREQERAFLPSTVLTIGSITKPFTARAILKIQEMSRLQMHDSSVDLIDTPHRNWNTSGTLIPVRQL